MEDRKHTSDVAGAGAPAVDQWCLDDFANNTNNRAQLPSSLANVIDAEIIPRLFMLQTGGVGARKNLPSGKVPSSLHSSVEHFTQLIIAEATDDAYAMIEDFQGQGFELGEIMLELLSPAARLLGIWWEEDRIGFVDVTIGASRLKQIVHHYRRANALPVATTDKSILLLPAPNEAHTFGMLIISELFRNKGWTVGGGHPMDAAEADTLARGSSWDVVGFSLANDRLIEQLTKAISRVRKLADNPNLVVLVGGRAFAEAPDLCETVGADFAVSSPEDALRLSETAVASIAATR
jgi:methanogenic corrinoid protein MtbC1